MSLTFNGTSSKLEISNKLVSAYPATYFIWIKPTSTAVNAFAMGSGGTGEELAIYCASNNARAWQDHLSSGPANPVSTSTIVTSWQPCMAVFTSATSASIYYSSGAVVTADPGNGAANFSAMSRFTIGARPDTGSAYWWGGDLAEAAVWSSALTQANFDSLAAGATPESVAVGTLIDVWDLQTQASTQVGRVSGNVLTATSTSQGATHPITRSAVPTLTSPTGTQTGSSTASGTVSTDTGAGTLYYYASINATETVATIKASGASQAVSATGSQSVSFTGLSASTTYYAHYVHNAAGGDSAASNSASFTTTAGGSTSRNGAGVARFAFGRFTR